MKDQATELRNIVSRTERDDVHDSLSSPYKIMIAGGKGGVGVTTLAVNLAVSLSEQGARIVLIDANLFRGDVAAKDRAAVRTGRGHLIGADQTRRGNWTGRSFAAITELQTSAQLCNQRPKCSRRYRAR